MLHPRKRPGGMRAVDAGQLRQSGGHEHRHWLLQEEPLQPILDDHHHHTHHHHHDHDTDPHDPDRHARADHDAHDHRHHAHDLAYDDLADHHHHDHDHHHHDEPHDHHAHHNDDDDYADHHHDQAHHHHHHHHHHPEHDARNVCADHRRAADRGDLRAERRDRGEALHDQLRVEPLRVLHDRRRLRRHRRCVPPAPVGHRRRPGHALPEYGPDGLHGRGGGQLPDLRARRLRPVREPERVMRRHPGMRGGGQPERLHPARHAGMLQPARLHRPDLLREHPRRPLLARRPDQLRHRRGEHVEPADGRQRGDQKRRYERSGCGLHVWHRGRLFVVDK